MNNSKTLLTLLNNTQRMLSSRLVHHQSHMSCWQIKEHSPDLTSSLFLNHNCPVPVIRNPNDVLIRVKASSVNPIDVAISKGYAHSVLPLMNLVSELGIDKITYDPLPITPGRDLCGEVVSVGQAVSGYKKGDTVWGTIPPHRHGAHAQFVVTNACNIHHSPSNLSPTQASSLPFVALTAWSAICTFGGLNERNTFGKKVLVLGGSGGVGLVAIQLLRHWGANVVTTCQADAIQMIISHTQLSQDQCIDYNTNELLAHIGSFDFVLDASSSPDASLSSSSSPHRDQMTHFAIKYLRKWNNAKLVTLSSPVLKNCDQYGLLAGTGKSVIEASKETISGLTQGVSVRWAFYVSDPCALAAITKLVEKGIVKPVVEKVVHFEDLIDAFTSVSFGHARGKTVVDLDSKIAKDK